MLLAWVVIAPIYRSCHLHDEIRALYNYAACFDGIAIGCLVAIIKPKHAIPRGVAQLVIPASAAVMVWTYFSSGIMANVVFGISSMAIATGAILLCSTGPLPALLQNRATKFIQRLGQNSYELYLFHIIVLAFMRTLMSKSELGHYLKPVWFVIFVVASVGVAELIMRYFSEPMNRWIRGMFVSGDLT